MAKLLYEDLTYKIRGACFEVWKEFGGAFKESVVDKALNKSLRDRGLKIESQKQIPVYFKDEKVGSYVPDKIVEGKVLIELKVKPKLTKGDYEQFWKYLKGSSYKLGLLVIFTPEKLIIKRVVYDKARK